jgi:hypothetical protein
MLVPDQLLIANLETLVARDDAIHYREVRDRLSQFHSSEA